MRDALRAWWSWGSVLAVGLALSAIIGVLFRNIGECVITHKMTAAVGSPGWVGCLGEYGESQIGTQNADVAMYVMLAVTSGLLVVGRYTPRTVSVGVAILWLTVAASFVGEPSTLTACHVTREVPHYASCDSVKRMSSGTFLAVPALLVLSAVVLCKLRQVRSSPTGRLPRSDLVAAAVLVSVSATGWWFVLRRDVFASCMAIPPDSYRAYATATVRTCLATTTDGHVGAVIEDATGFLIVIVAVLWHLAARLLSTERSIAPMLSALVGVVLQWISETKHHVQAVHFRVVQPPPSPLVLTLLVALGLLIAWSIVTTLHIPVEQRRVRPPKVR